MVENRLVLQFISKFICLLMPCNLLKGIDSLGIRYKCENGDI